MSNEQGSEKVLHMISKGKIDIMLYFPFFGNLLYRFTLKRKDEVGTMGTDGEFIYYNNDFVEKMPQKEFNFVLIHEVMHVALGHLWRRGTRIHMIHNIACDYAIHDIIHEALEKSPRGKNFMEMRKDALYNPDFHGLSSEEIYEELIKNANKNKKSQGNGSGKSGKSGKSGNNDDNNGDWVQQLVDELLKDESLMDNHQLWDDADKDSDSNKSRKRAEWSGKMASAKMSTPGTLPLGIERHLDKFLNPRKNWRTLLHEFIEYVPNDFGWNPPDNRFPDSDFFMPDFSETDAEVKGVLAWIDASGSIQNRELTDFYSELAGAISQFGGKLQGYLGFFDTKTYGPTEFESLADLLEIKPQGGGGTSFTKPLNKSAELVEDLNLHGVIMFTDGYAEFPKENPLGVPLLWIMTSNIEAPYGINVKLYQGDED